MKMTEELRAQALRVAGAVDPEVLTGAQAAAAVDDLVVAENATAATLLFLALRVAKTNAWQGHGFATAADWLAAKAGISVHEANRQLGTARRAKDLGKTEQAMKDGKLSPTQADAVSDAATADPSSEDDLLDLAERETTRNLKDEASKRKAAATDDATRERRIRRDRSVRRYVDREGAFNLHLRGPAADGVAIEALLRPYEEQAFRTGRADGIRDSFENRSYDAFLGLLGLGVDATGKAASPQQSGQSGQSGQPGVLGRAPARPATVPGGDNVKVIVTVDHAALLRGNTVAGETCHIAGVGPVSVQAVRDILRTDPFLAVVVKKGQDVVNVAHHGRGLNAAQRTALEAGGVRCSNIACNRTVAIQVDHRVPYASDPVTKLDNQDPLCTPDHQLKTHHGYALEPGTGRRRFLAPDHPDHPAKRAPGAHEVASPGRSGRATGPPPQKVAQPTLC